MEVMEATGAEVTTEASKEHSGSKVTGNISPAWAKDSTVYPVWSKAERSIRPLSILALLACKESGLPGFKAENV